MDSPWRLCAVAASLLAVAGCTEQAPKLLSWSPAPAPQRVIVNPNAPAAARPFFVPNEAQTRLPPARWKPDARGVERAAPNPAPAASPPPPAAQVRQVAASAPATSPVVATAASLGPIADNPASVIVQSGETLYDISRRYHVPLRLLLDANQLRPPYHILAGQRLALPKPPTHLVRPGETLYGLSRLYHVGLFELASANKIPPPYRLDTGTVLVIPPPEGGPPVPPLVNRPPSISVPPLKQSAPALAQPRVAADRAAPPLPQPAPRVDQREAERAPERHRSERLNQHEKAQRETAKAAPRRPASRIEAPLGRARPFLWPVQGRVLVGFGPESDGLSNDGINIAVREGTPVHAAAGGVVVYAGNELKGYGNLLLIRHADGWITAYAHNAKLLVRRGQRVTRGEIVARAGETGGVTSPQLHFEIRHGARPVDPLHYLSALPGERGTRAG